MTFPSLEYSTALIDMIDQIMSDVFWSVHFLRLHLFFLFTGLIDYNFHCFRKAIHEVFEVGVSTQRPAGPTALGSPCSKAVTLNGTPRNTV